MKKILQNIIESIVENTDQVEVTETEQEGTVNLNVKLAKEDMGRVIGKNGKIIKAIRNVMKIPAIKQNKRIFINLEETA